MRLAEELCIENFSFLSEDDEKDIKIDETGQIFKRQTSGLEGIDSEEILQLKALCHVNLKRKQVHLFYNINFLVLIGTFASKTFLYFYFEEN